jgi:predicted nucleic acid-binding protein
VTVFVDTSVWYAAADRADRSNRQAQRILTESDDRLTSDHVLVETWSLIRHRLGWDAAERFWEGLRGGVAKVEAVGPADLEAAWSIGEAFEDQDFSIVDRTSFSVMQRLGITQVATFDDDFAVYRFGRHRDRAFTVIR